MQNCGINVSKYPIKSMLDDGILLLNDGTLFLFENPPGSTNRVYITVDLNGYYKNQTDLDMIYLHSSLLTGNSRLWGNWVHNIHYVILRAMMTAE